MDNTNRTLARKTTEGDVVDSYSKVAWFYSLWSSLTESRAARKVIELADIQDGEHILEVAVGTGPVFAEIVKRNSSGITNGLDLSPAMLARAERRMKGQSDQHYTLSIGSAYKIPFEANTFDLLINNFMIDLLPEPDFPKILSEFHRVLKPGGRIVLSTMTFGRRWYSRFWDWLAKNFPSLLTNCRPVAMSPFLAAAGFESISSVYLSQNTFPSEVLKATKPAVRESPPSVSS